MLRGLGQPIDRPTDPLNYPPGSAAFAPPPESWGEWLQAMPYGLPNWAIAGGVAVLGYVVFFGGRRRRR